MKSLVLSVLTMTVGGSAGKEAPCADAGAGIGSVLGRILHMSAEDQRKMMICGVSAGFAGVFGVPISGALFGLEVLWVGHIFYDVMVSGVYCRYYRLSGNHVAGRGLYLPPHEFCSGVCRAVFLKSCAGWAVFRRGGYYVYGSAEICQSAVPLHFPAHVTVLAQFYRRGGAGGGGAGVFSFIFGAGYGRV